MKQIIAAQRQFFNTQATKDIKFRRAQLEKLERILKENMSALDAAIFADFKKSAFENYISEFALLFHDIKEARSKLERWSHKKRVSTNFANFPSSSFIIPEPLGVCLVIGAWNYPYQLSLAPAIAAISAGNTVVLKPSELPSQTSALMARLINDNFDSGFFKVVEGGIPETTALLEQKFDKIFFTGSTKVGKIVYKAAADNLTPVTLELGGKSPAFVMKDANLKMAAKRLIWAKYLNAGQTCIAPDYVLVEEEVKSTFLEYCKAEILKADYAFKNGNYLQIINDDNFDRLTKLINASKIYHGGKTDKANLFMEPTILKDVNFDDACMQEEIFGPILPFISFNKLDDVVAKVSSLPKPLSCYIFTSSSKTQKRLLHDLPFGGGAVNDAVMHITNPHLPFGGVGHSGIGNYHGEAGFKAFSHYKSVMVKPTWLELPLKYSPYSKTKLKWLKRLMKLQ